MRRLRVLRSSWLKEAEEKVVEALKRRGSVLIAFSGGVDSSVVAALAFKALKEKAVAITFKSPLHPPWELEEAEEIAEEIGVKHLTVDVNELELSDVVNNTPNRCYSCKSLRFSKAVELASKLKLNCVVDGTNADDVKQWRPGLRALKELGIHSPLLEAGLGEREVRELAKELGLAVSEKPHSSCLATRFPYGRRLSVELLRRVAEAEKIVKEVAGVKQVRVRDHGDLARVEVEASEHKRLVEGHVAQTLASRLKKLGYRFVSLDLEGYRFGSFDRGMRYG